MNIKEIRSRTGLSQKEFAEKLEIPLGTIRNWEQGLRSCPEYVIKLIEYKIENDKQ